MSQRPAPGNGASLPRPKAAGHSPGAEYFAVQVHGSNPPRMEKTLDGGYCITCFVKGQGLFFGWWKERRPVREEKGSIVVKEGSHVFPFIDIRGDILLRDITVVYSLAKIRHCLFENLLVKLINPDRKGNVPQFFA